MKISDIDFIKLLPNFMKSDDADKSLSKGVNQAIQPLSKRVEQMPTWNKIDELSAAELDLLADELHISWYDKNSPLDVKRELIKKSDIIHSKLGTSWAAMQVVNAYFGTGKIIDWYEYGGKPGHFRIETANQSILNSEMRAFLNILEKVKRKSAKLDKIELISDGTCEVSVFIATVEVETISTIIKR